MPNQGLSIAEEICTHGSQYDPARPVTNNQLGTDNTLQSVIA
jgi:hypothetical protein